MNPVIIIQNNNGFFSCATERLRMSINFYNDHKILPIIDSSNQWGGYKDNIGDITEKFFKNNEDFIFNIENFNFTDSPQEDQFSDYSLINFEKINFFLKKYFLLSDEVLKIKSELISKYKLNLEKTLSVYYRGNDKINETNIPSYDEFLEIVQNEIRDNSIESVLIQSDEKEFYNFMSEKLNNVIIFDEIIKPNKGNFNNQNTIPSGSKTYHAQLFLSIVSLISESKTIVLNSCNTSMWICLLRGNVKNVIQYLNPKEYIYGVRYDNYNLIKEKWLYNNKF